MGLQAFLGLDNDAQVNGLGEGAVIGCHTAHVDDAFLEADDPADGDNGHALQSVGTAGTDLGRDLTDDAGEHLTAADLYAGLDNVLNGGDTGAFAGSGDIQTALDELVILQNQRLYFCLVDIQHMIFDVRLFCKLNIIDFKLAEL